MIVRFLGITVGISIILFILFLRGLPVLILLKAVPLILLLLIGVAFIYAGVTSD